MSVLRDTLAAVRDILMMRKELSDLTAEVKALSAKHSDTRERLIRVETLIEGAMARRLGRG